MHISDLLDRAQPAFSFEFFPPRTAASAEKLDATLHALAAWRPAFVSVTYGAGGTTRHFTMELVAKIQRETCLEVIPHLTCVGHSNDEIQYLLAHYAQTGVGNILALRGDAPQHAPSVSDTPGSFRHAADLVRTIRRFNNGGLHPSPRGFGIGVAAFPEGHPGAANRLTEMDHLKAKVDAGADYLCTQLFFDNHDFYDFRDRCELAGIHVPILAGLMPVTTLAGLHRMAELAPRTRFPASLLRAAQGAHGDDAALCQSGIEHLLTQATDLLANDVDGLHFYTLNQASPIQEILHRLPLTASAIAPPVTEVLQKNIH